mmetsp:Transcript_8194/g.20688  ORF Transcript_8194/g.20688 Transcript_8194/m.20688 type:complete len:91 (-) Transcript_8194:154-426(-)
MIVISSSLFVNSRKGECCSKYTTVQTRTNERKKDRVSSMVLLSMRQINQIFLCLFDCLVVCFVSLSMPLSSKRITITVQVRSGDSSVYLL